jgi:hypothetical protein
MLRATIFSTALFLGQVFALETKPLVLASPADCTPDGGDSNLCNGVLCGAAANDPSACATGCCSGGYCADNGSCVARNILVTFFMVALVGMLITMCCLGIKAQNAVNKKFLDSHQASVLGYDPKAASSEVHQD